MTVINANLNRKLAPVAGGADAFLADDRGGAVSWALKEIKQRLAADQTLVVVPEGVMINYLTRRENPTPYINFMPPEAILFTERSILASFRERRPDYVLVVHKDTAEYGFHFFGRDYGQQIMAWIDRNYRLVASIGAPPLQGDSFGMALMQRNDRD